MNRKWSETIIIQASEVGDFAKDSDHRHGEELTGVVCFWGPGDGLNMGTKRCPRMNLHVCWHEPQGGGYRSLEKEQIKSSVFGQSGFYCSSGGL